MKKKILIITATVLMSVFSKAQETVYPATSQKGTVALVNGTVHVGNGTVIENGTVIISNGKITEVKVGANIGNATVIDCKGKHIYPGLILPSSYLGLVEISSVRASSDQNEIETIAPNIRSIVAYNADSKVINTLRSNGILLANVIPGGGLINGSSSVVQLDAWNWEDAAYAMDNGIHFNMPSLMTRRGGGRGGFAALFGQQNQGDAVKRGLEQIETVKSFLREAKAYLAETKHTNTNLKFEAVKGLFSKKQKFYVRCNIVKEMLVAIDFVKEFDFETVIVGGSESWIIADLLKQNNLSVILDQMHSLPTMVDDDIDQPYKTPGILQKAGVLFCINDDDSQNRGRNISFNAGTAATYGLTKEEALTAITLSAAKILGIDARTGSLEYRKDANVIVSDGDILDMKSSVVTHAFIQGRAIDLNNKHKQLNERYKHKYGIK